MAPEPEQTGIGKDVSCEIKVTDPADILSLLNQSAKDSILQDGVRQNCGNGSIF